MKIKITFFKKLSATVAALSELSIFLGVAFIFFKVFLKTLLIFRQRGREGEREGEKHQCVVVSHLHPSLGT